MGIDNVGLLPQAHPEPGIGIPDRPTVPNLRKHPQISRRQPLREEPPVNAPRKFMPSEITRAPIADFFLGRLNTGNGGIEVPDMTRDAILGTLGYPTANILQNRQAATALQEVLDDLTTTTDAVLKTVDKRGLTRYRGLNRGTLEKVSTEMPAGDSSVSQADTAQRIKNVDAALAQHADQLPPTLRPATPPTTAK